MCYRPLPKNGSEKSNQYLDGPILCSERCHYCVLFSGGRGWGGGSFTNMPLSGCDSHTHYPQYSVTPRIPRLELGLRIGQLNHKITFQFSLGFCTLSAIFRGLSVRHALKSEVESTQHRHSFLFFSFLGPHFGFICVGKRTIMTLTWENQMEGSVIVKEVDRGVPLINIRGHD